jgi:hypothetical protein
MTNRVTKDMIHGFSVPHDKARPTGASISVEIPSPPRRVGAIITPEQARDVLQHNVVCGKIIKMGPLAFVYRDADGTDKREDVSIGDWVTFRPYAGTILQPDGKVGAIGGVRYLSSHRDVLATYAAGDMLEAEAYLNRQKALDAEDEAEQGRAA